MKNHYKALVDSGFLLNAHKQLKEAGLILKGSDGPFFEDKFMWYFDLKNKKADFSQLYNDLEVAEYITEAYNSGAEDTDVIILNAPDFVILCGQRKKIVMEATHDQYDFEGIIPYYITKRKIDGKIYWFSFSWLTVPFNIPNYN